MRKGKFELADGGTLFLDEIGDMELSAQSKVLKAIETATIMRLGGQREIEVDVRILAASNKDLLKEMQKGTFREDLFYRLEVVEIHIPPLRERREDIPELVRAFLEDYALENGTKIKKIDPAAMDYLRDNPWPGNVRELRNAVERLAILSSGETIGLEDVQVHLQQPVRRSEEERERESFQGFKEGAEQEFLRRSLEENDWNVSETARKLGMQRSNLYKKMEKYGLRRGEEKPGP
jgi:two-component system nitrogen regulation response regulator NtrX